MSDDNMVNPKESISNADNDLDEVGRFCGSKDDQRKLVNQWTNKFMKIINKNEIIDVNKNDFNKNKEIK